MKRSDLPFGSEFSPSQIELARVLEMAEQHGGDWRAFETEVRSAWFEGHATSDYNRGKLANNTKLGMIAYGIIDRNAALTSLGRELLELRATEDALYRHLARHILLNLKGMTLVRCIQDMEAAGEAVNVTTLREGLALRGVHYPRGGKHPSIMRLWLAKAGVFVGKRWHVDSYQVEEIIGVDMDEYGALGEFTSLQRAFLRALANAGTTVPQRANEVAKLASITFGEKFPEKSLPKLVLHDLEAAGYIKTEKTTVGRGAKPFLVRPTEKLVADVVEPLLEQLRTQTDPRLALHLPTWIRSTDRPTRQIRAPRCSEWVRVGGLPALLTCRRPWGVTFDTLHAQLRWRRDGYGYCRLSGSRGGRCGRPFDTAPVSGDWADGTGAPAPDPCGASPSGSPGSAGGADRGERAGENRCGADEAVRAGAGA